jgi:hypothetical protein
VKTLEEFLNENIAKGHSEFRLVARQRDKYTTSFYIHCFGHDSDTLDFEVDENTLSPDSTVTRIEAPPPATRAEVDWMALATECVRQTIARNPDETAESALRQERERVAAVLSSVLSPDTPSAEVDREAAINDFRMDELDAVMHSVRKWLPDDYVATNPATEAADAREIALKAIEHETARTKAAEAEVNRLKRVLADEDNIKQGLVAERNRLGERCIAHEARLAALRAEGGELYEIIDKLCKLGNGDHDGNSDGNRLAQKARALLARAPRAEGWISVEERLPETTGYCLVFAGNCGEMKKAFWNTREWENGETFASLEAGGYTITHWMPLPEPPKEAE